LDVVGRFVGGHLFNGEHPLVPETRQRSDRHHADLWTDIDGAVD
jgi:hypothetical protein